MHIFIPKVLQTMYIELLMTIRKVYVMLIRRMELTPPCEYHYSVCLYFEWKLSFDNQTKDVWLVTGLCNIVEVFGNFLHSCEFSFISVLFKKR